MLKSTNILLLCFAFLIIVTSGCIGNPKKDDDECENQTFIIDEIKEGELFISEESALPEKFTLKLKACIRAYEKIETKLPHTFWAISRNAKILKSTSPEDFKDDKIAKPSTILSTNENEIIKTNTDGTGCISWEEVYDYAHNDQSEWILLERHIRGISSQRPGVCTVPLAVNPWLQLEKYKNIQVADYRDRYKRNDTIINKRIVKDVDGLTYLKRKKAEEQKNKVDITINPLQLNTYNTLSTRKTQRVYQNTIIATLTYKVKDIHGGLQSNPVPRGDFVIEPVLLINKRTAKEGKETEAEDKDQFNVKEEFIRLSANDRIPVKTRFSDDQMTSDTFQWTTPHEKLHSQIQLYLKVTPFGETAQRINPFEGIFAIGNKLDKLLSNNILTLPINDILRIKYDNSVLEKNEDIFSEEANPDWVALNECLKNLETPSTSKNPIATCLQLEEILTGSSRGAVKAGWNVGDLNIRFFNMQKENWLYREITSLVKTHISDVSIGPIRREPINIEILDLTTGAKQQITKPTEDNGNISFNVATQQQWYKRQRYFLKRIRFYAATGELRSEKLIAINPWDYGFTHGYEVNQAENIRTTCLEETDLNGVKTLLEKGQLFERSQIDIMHRMFCHNPEETKYLDPDITFQPLSEVFSVFRNTLLNLFYSDFNMTDTLQTKFYKKFTSINEVKIPESYVHLFRSINVYPTPLIDSSLTREVYYNIRFKLTPRVVRHDDVPRGQQNKGPLRDGIYIFQMAVLANDQGRVNGRGNMVKTLEQFHPNTYINTDLAGTRSLFSCPINQEDCVELDDFIIPPQNIPIVVRDGMIKVDIPIHIRSEDLLFADSKNILVFKIVPADPKSVECKAGEPLEHCTLEINNGVKRIYASAFDWKKTIQNIKPANENDYDMFFHTYKTPFIPAAWGNWNITHELNESFDDIANQHKYLKVDEIFDSLLDGWNKRRSYSERRYTETDPTRALEDHDGFYLKKLYEEIDKYQNLMEQHTSEEKRTNAVNTIETKAEQLKKILLESRAKIEQDDTLTEEQKTRALEKIDKMLEEANDAQSLISFIVSPETTELPEESHTAVDPDTIPQNHVTDTHTHRGCVDTDNYIDTITRVDEEWPVTDTQDNPAKDNCLADPEKTNETDLSDRHISYFASQNHLCTIHVNSNLPLSENNCGRFSAPEEAQQSFVDDLNRQIEFINDKRKIIYELDQQLTRNFNPLLQTEEDTPKEPPGKPMEEAFQREHNNSRVVANKMKNLPNLPLLNAADLENIILSDIDDNTIRDLKTGAFLHALCGFWFENFFSNKYTREELLLEGLRNIVKQSFYYQIRGISALPHERDNILMQNFKAGLEEMKQDYDEYLSDQKAKGHIDELHKWVNNEEQYGFDSPFDRKLRNTFQTISSNTPLSGTRPSWVDREGTISPSHFSSQDYLDEAIDSMKKRRSGLSLHTLRYENDNHPFRKCIMNPSHFFGFEKKIIMGKTSNSTKYGTGGEITTLNISEAFLMNTQRDQGANQQFELGSTLAFLSLPFLAYGLIGGLIPSLLRIAKIGRSAFKKPVTNLGGEIKSIFNTYHPGKHFLLPAVSGTALAFSGIVGGYAYRTYEGTGKRRWISVQVIETAELIAEHTPILVGLEKYHECLVIRPRFSAFESHTDKYDHIWAEENQVLRSIYEKTGILLCTEGKKENHYIQEDYYYIYPNYAMNGITIDPKSHRNKPFTISLRGTKEYQRFLHNLSCHVSETTEPEKNNMDCQDTRGEYENLFLKNIEFARNLRQGFDTPKMFHLTSDAPGVHSPYKEPEDRKPRTDTNAVHDIINWFTGFQFMDMDLEKIVRKEPE